jgi:aspartyl-tRNA(Asn)/glutamyl-tRNA(Gln) amidotransferase subunit B
VAAFFEEAATLHGEPTKVANFVQSEVLRDVVTRGLAAEIPVSARQVAQLLKLVDARTISGKQAKELYARLRGTDDMPADVVASLGLAQVSDEALIERIVKTLVEANPKQAEAARGGKTALLGFFVGQVMKETKGSADPQLVQAVLRRVLGIGS